MPSGSVATLSAIPPAPRTAGPSLPPWPLRGAVALALIWWSALAAMTWQTADPPDLSFVQIAESDAILEARPVAAGDRTRWHIAKTWDVRPTDRVSPPTGDVTLTNAAHVQPSGRGTSPGDAWLIPVRQTAGGWEVTFLPPQPPAPGLPPRIYLATPFAYRQLTDILQHLP